GLLLEVKGAKINFNVTEFGIIRGYKFAYSVPDSKYAKGHEDSRELVIKGSIPRTLTEAPEVIEQVRKWAKVEYEDRDTYYNWAKLTHIYRDETIRYILFPDAFVKDFIEEIDPHTGDGIYTLILMQKLDKRIDIEVGPFNEVHPKLSQLMEERAAAIMPGQSMVVVPLMDTIDDGGGVEEAPPVAAIGNFRVTVAMRQINGVHNLNNRNYAGLRDMVHALENTNDSLDLRIPEATGARRVVWNSTTGVATMRVTHRRFGHLVTRNYDIARAGEANRFLVINDRIMITVRELAELAGLADYRLEWHNIGTTQFVTLYEQKRVIFQNTSGHQTTYTGFVDNDNAFLERDDAVALLGNGYTLTEHRRVAGYVNVSAAMMDRYSDNAEFIMANFHTTRSDFFANKTMQNGGTVTVIAGVPVAQRTRPAQLVRAGNYGLIRIFGEMEWPTRSLEASDPAGAPTIVPVADRPGLTNYIEAAVKAIGTYNHSVGSQTLGVLTNVWRNQNDFHVNSQIVWRGSGKNAISTGQLYHIYRVSPRTGRASAGPNLTWDNPIDRNITGANWSNNVAYTANLFAGSNFNNYLVIIHETFHLLGVEDSYEYRLASENMIKPRASTSLVPNASMMHSNQKITNVDMRLLFDASTNNHWTKFENYENEFEIVSATRFTNWQSGGNALQIANIHRGLMRTDNNKAMTNFNKEREFLMAADRVH
ncbi:MAG: hypothetical protein FWD82_10450, partial [Defluviitaleaceae bacterium]|nr:hypothetical protein [Defluviitaleaceae bacterium]